jgi:hypothetical protein
MKWPLVWRETYDELLVINERLQYDARHALERLAEAQRFAADALRALTQRPASPSENAHISKPLPQALPARQKDELQEAIELAAGVDSALARHLQRWSQQQKLDGAKEHDIIQAILHWKTADVWDGDTDDVPAAF